MTFRLDIRRQHLARADRTAAHDPAGIGARPLRAFVGTTILVDIAMAVVDVARTCRKARPRTLAARLEAFGDRGVRDRAEWTPLDKHGGPHQHARTELRVQQPMDHGRHGAEPGGFAECREPQATLHRLREPRTMAALAQHVRELARRAPLRGRRATTTEHEHRAASRQLARAAQLVRLARIEPFGIDESEEIEPSRAGAFFEVSQQRSRHGRVLFGGVVPRHKPRA